MSFPIVLRSSPHAERIESQVMNGLPASNGETAGVRGVREVTLAVSSARRPLWQFSLQIIQKRRQTPTKLMGWTPPDGIYVPKWRC